MKVDLIIKTAGQLVTCASPNGPKRRLTMRDVGVIPAGAVAILGEKIVAVGPAAEVTPQYTAADVIDAGKRVICPGFVDPHTHIVYAGDRLDEFEMRIRGADYLDILASGGGILCTVRATREACADRLFVESRRRLDRMLRCGTTTAEIKTGYGLDLDAELKMLDVIERLDREHPVDVVPTFLPAHAVPPEYDNDADAYVDAICDRMLHAAWQWYEKSRFVRLTPFFVDVFTERNAFDVAQTSRIFDVAGRLGFKIKAHVDEFTNLGGSRLAIEKGAVSIDHLDAITDEEIYLLAASDTVAILTPAVNFNLASSHFANARKLVDSGCAVALSTNYNPGSAPCPSQPAAMAIACRYQKLLPAEAMNAATINAAFGIGLGNLVGSLEAEKQADLLVLETDDYRDLAYHFGDSLIRGVVKKGKPLSDIDELAHG